MLLTLKIIHKFSRLVRFSFSFVFESSISFFLFYLHLRKELLKKKGEKESGIEIAFSNIG